MLDFDQLVDDTAIEPEIVVPDSVTKRIRELYDSGTGAVWPIPALPEDELDTFKTIVKEATREVASDRRAYITTKDGDEAGTLRVTVKLGLKGGPQGGVEIGRSALSGRAW